MYSYVKDNGKNEKTAKGVRKYVIKKNSTHDNYKDCLLNGKEDFPFSHPPSQFRPFPSVPPEKVLFLLPIGQPFTGTHRPTIYRAFPNFISFHLISFHFILFLFVFV